MKKIEFDHLIGKTKEEILELLGHEFNDPYSAEWMYNLGQRKWLRQKYLMLEFKDGKVAVVRFKTKYF